MAAAFVMLAASSGPARAGGKIELLERTQASGSELTLGDVARLHDDDDAAGAQALAALPLGRSPALGDVVHLEQSKLAVWIARRAGPAGESWTLTGASKVRIERAAQAVPTTRITALAQEAIDGWLGARSDRHQAEAVNAATPTRALPAGQLTLQLRPFDRNLAPARRMRAWVELRVDGQPAGAVPVAFDVQAEREGWTARADLPAGHLLTANDVTRTAIDLTRQPAELLDTPPQGQRLRKPLRAGQVLALRDVQPPLAVERGATVALYSHDGLISVTRNAIALQKGHTGQHILVQPAGAARPVQAQVTGPARAEIAP